jgi:hypothetical protein
MSASSVASSRLLGQLRRLSGLSSLDKEQLNLLTLDTRAAIYRALVSRLHSVANGGSSGSGAAAAAAAAASGAGGDGGASAVVLPPHGPRREDARAFAVAVFAEVSSLVPSAPVSGAWLRTTRALHHTLLCLLV